MRASVGSPARRSAGWSAARAGGALELASRTARPHPGGHGLVAERAAAQHAHRLLVLVRVEMLDQQHPVEMIDLVLQHPPEKLLRFDVDCIPVKIEPAQ